jgi:peptide/nickel transport system substrate-binding protein
MRRLRMWFVGIASLGALVIAGCGGRESSSGAAASGGTLRIGIASTTVESLNPFVGQSSLSLLTYRVVYPYLMEYDNAGNLVRGFAESDKLSKNRLVWTFTTRPNAKWSDGTPLTAADAAWMINTVVKYQNGAAAALSNYATGLKSAVATSPNTLQVKLSAPTATVLNSVANIPILPKHIWERYAQGSAAQLKTFANPAPVGAGSFLVSHFAPSQFILFDRNKGYYGKAPRLARFGIDFYLNNDAMVNALKSNEIDVALDIPSTTIKDLRHEPGIEVRSIPGWDTVLLGINSNPAKTTNTELRNPTVREAIAIGIDRKKIADTVTLGTGGVTESILAPNHPFHDPAIGAPEYNLAKAKSLLDGLGYRLGSDGVRIANGHPMSYTLLFGNTTTGAPLVVNLIVQEMRKLGIKVNAIESDPTAYTAAINAGHYTKFDFSADDYGPDLEPGHYLSIPTCAQFGAENETGYCNKEYDALYSLQATQVGAARRATIDKMQEMIVRDRPLIPIYASPDIIALHDNVHGVEPTPIVIVNYQSKQWIDEATVK